APTTGDPSDAGATPVAELYRLPLPRLGRAVAGIDNRVHHVAVVERLHRRPALVHRVEHVREHLDVAELGDLVADRAEPAARGRGLPRDLPGARARAERVDPRAQEVVEPDRPSRARDLVAQVHPAAERPRDLELAHRT